MHLLMINNNNTHIVSAQKMTIPSLLSSFMLFIFVTHALDLSLIQMETGKCPYTVVVMTSCLSPDTTRDQISIAFGDANGNQVYTPRLGGPVGESPGRLGKCSTDTFQVKGQCLANPICAVYIYPTGPDGWVPEAIEIYSETSKSVRFDLSKSLPQNTWYGVNNCNTTGYPPSPPLPTPEFPPETPAFPPPPPPPLRPSSASRCGDGLSHAFVAFTIVIVAMVG